MVTLILLTIAVGACSRREPEQVVAAPKDQVQVTEPRPLPVGEGSEPKRAGEGNSVRRPVPSPGPAEPALSQGSQGERAQPPSYLERAIPDPPSPPPFQEPKPEPPPPPPVPKAPVVKQVTIPAGTHLFIRLIDSIDSETDRMGKKYQASLDAPVEVGGEIVLPSDIDVYLSLLEVRSAGRVAGRSEIRVQLDRIEVDGKSYTVESSVYEEQAASRTADTAKKAGIGAAIGAAIGAISGGAKGAVIGGAVGTGSGVGVQAIGKGRQVRIDSESLLEFRLEQPVTIEKIVKEM